MFTQDIEDILTLFALTIYADKRIFAEEIDVFMSLAPSLERYNTGPKPLSQAQLLAWFENHRSDLKTRLKTSDFETWLYMLLDRLGPIPNKKELLDSMAMLSKADKDVHVSEKALIVLTRKRWGLEA